MVRHLAHLLLKRENDIMEANRVDMNQAQNSGKPFLSRSGQNYFYWALKKEAFVRSFPFCRASSHKYSNFHCEPRTNAKAEIAIIPLCTALKRGLRQGKVQSQMGVGLHNDL